MKEKKQKKTKYANCYQSNKISNYLLSKEGETQNTNDEAYYGDTHAIKPNGTIRIWYTNPCGIGVDPMAIKSDDSFFFLKNRSKCDVFGLAETNIHWKMLYSHATLYSRVKQRWHQFKTSTSHNEHMKLGKTQRGGTCTVAVGQAAHRVFQIGSDPSGLGRWSWIEFRGKNDHLTRVYTAYRPGGKPSQTLELTTVYHQQAHYLRKHKIDREPRNHFDICIKEEIEEQSERCNIVLLIDVNQNVMHGHFTKMMKEMGLVNVFEILHSDDMPSTHHRGSNPISAIYISPFLQPTRAGILPKGIGVLGDHRNMFMDVTTASFLGSHMYMVKTPQMKRLHMGDSRIVKRFLKQTRIHIDANNIRSLSEKIVTKATYPISLHMQQQVENLDEQMGRAIRHAEKKCRKLRTGEIPFSGMFADLRDEYRMWLLVRKKKLGQKVSNTTIRRLAKRMKIDNPMSQTLLAATAFMKDSQKKYKQLTKQQARDGRMKFNEELAAANASTMKVSKSKVLARIIRDEQEREQVVMTRRFFPKRGAPGNNKVDRIQHKVRGQWREAYTPRGVLLACQNDTATKYNETGNTPLMTSRMHSLFGNFAETSYAQDLFLKKIEMPRNINQITKMMLQHTQQDPTIPALPITMTKEEVQAAWQKVKEKKASAPSGRYNATYKVISQDNDLLPTLTNAMNIPFLTGYPYKRWYTMVDIMAFKKPNNIKVNNIRSIIISEADWNTSGKVHVTKRMMNQAEICKLLPREHMGGRKGRKATDGALKKKLLIDNMRMMRKPMAIISTDAANCYDRMTHKYIELICMKWGLSV